MLFHIITKNAEPRRDEGTSGEDKGRAKSVIPSITTSKGNSTRVELKAGASFLYLIKTRE